MLTTGKHIQYLKKLLPNNVKHVIKQGLKPCRALTSRIRPGPDFLIVGVRKGGTTSIYNYLIQHPCVLPAMEKEIKFFTEHFEKGKSWYFGHFPTSLERRFYQRRRGHNILVGEATPSYHYHPLVPQRIFDMNGDIKLIAVLRNPVDRAYSDYYFGVTYGTYTTKDFTFEEAVDRELCYLSGHEGEIFSSKNAFDIVNRCCPFLGRGIYVEQLKSWFGIFPREQFLLLTSDELFSNPKKCFSKILEFLGLPPYELNTYEAFNEGRYPTMDPSTRAKLVDYFAAHNQRLSENLGVDTPWDSV